MIWVIFAFIPFVRGGSRTESAFGIEFCSTVYWIVTFAPYPIYMFISYLMIRIAKNYPVIGPNASLNLKQIIKLIVFGIIAGIASGFLGIGGGVIKGPMLLSLGIQAEEMAATSTFLVLLTSSITTIQYLANGLLNYGEFGIYVAFGFVSFLIGIFILKALIKRTNNRSLILFLLAVVVGIGACLLVYLGVDEVITALKQHKKMGFRKYCD